MDKTTKKLDIGNLINQAWELTKKHFPMFLLLLILGQAIGSLPSYSYYSENIMAIINDGVPMTEEEWIQHYISTSGILSIIFLYVVAVFGGFYVTLVTYRILFDAIENKKLDLTSQLKESFKYFFFFAGSASGYGQGQNESQPKADTHRQTGPDGIGQGQRVGRFGGNTGLIQQS